MIAVAAFALIALLLFAAPEGHDGDRASQTGDAVAKQTETADKARRLP